MRRVFFFASLFAVLPVGVVRAQGSIAGTVRDAATSAPLVHAIVLVVGTRLLAATDADGRYALTGVPPGTRALRALLVGYAPRDTSVSVADGQQVALDFQLRASAIELNPVVAVGYGTQRRGDVTGSVASVSSQQMATIPVARVDERLAGLVPGVQVQTTNAQPGAQLRIRVRGGNSLEGDNEPLVVVDGVIGADLNQINPNDIEAVDVLKDASATAIYGARGANGVILVTTKRGEPGRIRFEYSAYGGAQSLSKHILVLNADQFALLLMRNPTHDNTIALDTLNHIPTTDWQSLVYQTAPIQSHEIRVSGSTGGTSLMISANWFNQEGVVRASDFGRGSVRVNLDQDLSPRSRLGLRVSNSRSVGNQDRVNAGYGSGGGAITMEALRFAPTIPVYDSVGKFSGPLLSSQTNDNPVAMVNLLADKTTTDYQLGNVFGEYDLAPGLTLRSSLSYTSRHRLQQRYTSMLLRAALGSGQANIDNNDQTTWLSENTATLHRTLGDKHELTLLGGFTASQTRTATSSTQGVGFTSDELGYKRLNLASLVTGNSSSPQTRLVSFLGRVNYAFAGKYLLTGTLRADGSSKFALNNKWSSFPSAALAWRVSDEPFFHRIAPAVSELKLRVSAGRSGSEAIDPFQSLAAWSLGAPYAIGGTTFQNGAHPNRNANPNLRWETTTQYDAGLDLTLFDGRVNLTADAYHKTTTDLLYGKQVPYFTGFADYVTNIGKVRNRGLEVTLDTRHSIGAVDVRLGANLSLNRSRVLDLGGDQQFFMTGSNTSLTNWRDNVIIEVGQPLGNFYGYVWDGIFQDTAEVRASHQPGAVVGSMKLKDLDGNDSLTTDGRDKTVLGNALPRYVFGLTGGVTYRRFSLSWIVRGALDFQVVNVSRAGMETPGSNLNSLPAVLDYWTPTHHTNKMTAMGIGPYDGLTSRWVEDGSFIRLQNVTVSWDVLQEVGARFGVRQLRIYLSAQNLFTATRYSWYDPEISSRGTSDLTLGWDDSGYPGTKTVSFGMNVGF
jgi:TonB-linked SusC/RagA family outer membrane protein